MKPPKYKRPEDCVPVSARDLCSPDRVGRYAGTEESAILDLAREFQRRENPARPSTSWDNQVKAFEVFKRGGLVAVLTELHK